MLSPFKLRRLAALIRSPAAEHAGPVATAPAAAARAVVRRFWPDARPYRRRLMIVAALAALVPIAEGGSIACYGLLVDDVLVPRDVAALVWVGGLFAGLSLVASALALAGEYLLSWVAERFVLGLRTRVFAHLQSLSLEAHDRRRLGDVLARLGGDVEAIERLMLSGVADGLAYLLRIVLFSAALFVLEWRLALAALLGAPLFFWVSRHFSREIKDASRERRRRAGSLSAVAEESLANAMLVQAYQREGAERERFEAEGRRVVSAELALTRLREAFASLVDGVETLGALVVVAFGVRELAAGRTTLGELAAFLGFLTQLYAPVRRLSRLVTTLHGAWAGAERVMELLDERPQVSERRAARRLGRAVGAVAFERVGFRYPGVQGDTLREVSLAIEPGATVALVGASGAGKSTLAKLALRFYDPTAGAIRLDARDLRDLRLADVRSNITLLPQETLILHASVRDNIAFGREAVSDEAIAAAAVSADADAFVRQLPDGYDTLVGERGRTLSGGQRQRLAIARALLRDAPVLILDEPTTGLDAHAQARVLEPLRRLMDERTTVLISHTLAAARAADTVAVLDQGRLVEHGAHAELIALGGAYAALWDRQDAGERAAPALAVG